MAKEIIEKDFEDYVHHGLEWLRSKHHIRKGLALIAIACLVGVAGKFAYELYPRHYKMTVSGGGMLTKSHFLAKILEEEASQQRLSLKVVPIPGSYEALQALDNGSLDLAFVQSGIDVSNYPNVRYVASIEPELVQFLVKPNIKQIADLKGKTINLGKKHEGVSVISNQILHFSGFVPDVDFTETDFSDEELLSMKPDLLPDVIVQVAYAPSPVVDFLVQKRDYRLLEMPFPPSLATRLGWVADSKILAYMYRIVPPVPATDIQVVGVNLNILAGKNVDPRAIVKFLKVLYSPFTAARFGIPIPEDRFLTSSGFQLSSGTEAYIEEKQPFITNALLDRIKATIGLIMSLGSILLVVFKWFRRPEDDQEESEEVPASHGDLPVTASVHDVVVTTGPSTATTSVTDRLGTAISSVESLDK